jgi:LacI family transcriptional regulator
VTPYCPRASLCNLKEIPRIFVAVEQSRVIGRGLLRGMSKYARIHGPWMILTKHDRYFGGSDFPPLRKGTIHGAIIREPRTGDLKKIHALRVPIVLCAHWTTHPSLPYVITDCQRIGQMAATHFLDRGFRRFAFCGTNELFWSERRCRSFIKTVAKAGYNAEVYKIPVSAKNRLWHNELPILAEWLASLPTPTALMACTDDRAFELVEACNVAGLRVPEEIAILGVDNDDIVCETATVSISSVALDLEQAGYEAAALLDKLMNAKNPRQQEIIIRPTHVQERRSTEILAIEDPVVAKALHYIRTHAQQSLQVGDVAQFAAVSKRGLFTRFQAVLGRSVHDEITRVRIGKIAWMLETTVLSIKQIAEIMGMPDERHLSRYFQAQKGMSPIAWRKQQARRA